MKLLSHNMLTSSCIKGVVVGYPLGIKANEVKLLQVTFNPDTISRVIPKVDWKTLYEAASAVGHVGELPAELPADWENDQQLLKIAHHVLLEVDIVEGDLICPETGRKFPITNGIPNMLLNEDEVQL